MFEVGQECLTYSGERVKLEQNNGCGTPGCNCHEFYPFSAVVGGERVSYSRNGSCAIDGLDLCQPGGIDESIVKKYNPRAADRLSADLADAVPDTHQPSPEPDQEIEHQIAKGEKPNAILLQFEIGSHSIDELDHDNPSVLIRRVGGTLVGGFMVRKRSGVTESDVLAAAEMHEELARLCRKAAAALQSSVPLFGVKTQGDG